MKLFLVIAAVLAIAVGAFVVWFGMPKGPSLDEVVHLEQPRITTMPLQKVIQAVAKGNPNAIGKDAFGWIVC